MNEIVRSTFPELDIVPAGQELKMMKQAMARLNSVDESKNFQTMLTEVSTVLKRQGATVVNLTYRDDSLEITFELNNFSQVNQLSNQLNARPKIKADLLSSSADDGEVFANFVIKHS